MNSGPLRVNQQCACEICFFPSQAKHTSGPGRGRRGFKYSTLLFTSGYSWTQLLLLCTRLLGGDLRPGLDVRWIWAKFIHFPNRDLGDALPFPFLLSHHSSGVLALPQPELPHLSWDAPRHEPWLRGGFPKETWLAGLKHKLSRGMSPLSSSPEAAELGLFTKPPGYSHALLSSSSSLAPWGTQ